MELVSHLDKKKKGEKIKKKIHEGISGANKLVRKPLEWSQSEAMVSWTFKVAEAAVEGITLYTDLAVGGHEKVIKNSWGWEVLSNRLFSTDREWEEWVLAWCLYRLSIWAPFPKVPALLDFLSSLSLMVNRDTEV